VASKIKIKVAGVGGSGGNAISRMMKTKLFGVDLIAINTDAQDLKRKKAGLKIRIGRRLTQGLGTGMNPALGKKAALEQKEEISEALTGSSIVFVTTGLGGGTGSGASPVVADIAKKGGALTVGVVTIPFSFEGRVRTGIARRARRKLKQKVDSLIVIPNDNLLSLLDSSTSLSQAFWICDEILRQAVKGITDLITLPGIVNVDFADVRSIIQNSGNAFFGIGRAKGENRAKEAARLALSSSLLDFSVSRARGILFNVSGGPDISLFEINEAAKIVTKNTSSQTKVIFGAIQDEELKKGEMKVTVIATGF
jgi:cell division protein FtsZ